MAQNIVIETGDGLDSGSVTLTLLAPSETGGIPDEHALMTVRGKDHLMGEKQLEELGNACLKLTKLMRKRRS